MKRLLKFKDPTLRSGGRNNGKNKPTNGTRKHYTRLDYTTLHERHSEGGTTEETLSIHCKIQRYALEDGIMGKTQNETSHFYALRNYNNLYILAVLTYQLKIVCLKVALHL